MNEPHSMPQLLSSYCRPRMGTNPTSAQAGIFCVGINKGSNLRFIFFMVENPERGD